MGRQGWIGYFKFRIGRRTFNQFSDPFWGSAQSKAHSKSDTIRSRRRNRNRRPAERERVSEIWPPATLWSVS